MGKSIQFQECARLTFCSKPSYKEGYMQLKALGRVNEPRDTSQNGTSSAGGVTPAATTPTPVANGAAAPAPNDKADSA